MFHYPACVIRAELAPYIPLSMLNLSLFLHLMHPYVSRWQTCHAETLHPFLMHVCRVTLGLIWAMSCCTRVCQVMWCPVDKVPSACCVTAAGSGMDWCRFVSKVRRRGRKRTPPLSLLLSKALSWTPDHAEINLVASLLVGWLCWFLFLENRVLVVSWEEKGCYDTSVWHAPVWSRS